MSLHIASSDMSRQLRRLVNDMVIPFTDNLLVGPCPHGVTDFIDARVRYWRDVPGSGRTWRAMYGRLVEALGSHSEITLWSSGSLQFSALRWMICSLTRERSSTRIIARMVDRGNKPRDDLLGCCEERLGLSELRALLRGGAQPISKTQRRADERRWRSFTSSKPVRFSVRCRTEDPVLRRMRHYHLQHFPRMIRKQLHVSLLDELLLKCVSRSWSHLGEILMRRSDEGVALRTRLYCTGDAFMVRRLHEWLGHDGQKPVIDVERQPSNALPSGVRYRMTRRGLDLLERGIRDISDGPACSIGGGAAYDPAQPIVAVMDGGEWTLAELRGTSRG
ncbi:hypothetical protein [Chondromyces apiculatus]|uniref:hypothetical protein n=1 Tax=Chondromyces apiculatus TaxID=51 RepID=UPI0012DDB50E|nr:hypothetical protein [Chondromyces apiculatus]